MALKMSNTEDIVMAAALLLAEVNPDRLREGSGPGKSVYVPKRSMTMLLAEFEQHAPEILETARDLRAARTRDHSGRNH
jgi:hypothetical protein